jgi:polyisoprenyl-phosphate glycosyltransferase
MSQPELSIVIPFLNEEQVLPLLRERLESIRNRPAGLELIFVSDGSTDGSTAFIEAWAQTAPSVKLVGLTRNFGHQSAISAGLSFASGNCVGIMDADLQDEPDVLLEMYQILPCENVAREDRPHHFHPR